MTTEREQELERRVGELERESDLGWNLFLFGPLALLADALDRRGRRRRERTRSEARERFEAWLDGLGAEEHAELDAVLEQGLPPPDGASGDFVLGFRAHSEILRALVRDRALWHVTREDDARELLKAGGIDWEAMSVEWLRGFQASNAELARRFDPARAT